MACIGFHAGSEAVAQGAWNAVDSPPARDSHAMAFDHVRNRLVLFGGQLSGPIPPIVRGDTWEWDGTRWHATSPAASPSARTETAMAFDSARNRVVLFGGASVGAGGQEFNDTWEWDGTTWTQASPTTSPPARSGHAMAFDLIRGRAVLHGGHDGSGPLSDTWEWDGTTWTQVAFQMPGPAVADHGMVFDVLRNRMVVFGGEGNTGLTAETWELFNGGWSLVQPTTGTPQARTGFTFVFDIFSQRAVLFGGFGGGFGSALGDVWSYDGLNAAWQQHTPASGPMPRWESAGVFDQQSQRVLVFGGLSTGGLGGIPRAEMWGWNGTSWTEVRSDPTFRSGHAVAQDPTTGGVLLFGGDDGRGNVLGDTWRWLGQRWERQAPTASPAARELAAMTLDPVRGRVVLFGGFDGSSNRGDTWEWDGANWTQLTLANAPSARQGHGMAWDPVGQRILLFGGIDTGVRSDTWSFDGSTWTQLSPATMPPARARHGMSTAPERDRVVMFGGVGSAYLNDTWEWQGTNWVRINSPQAPPGRRGFAFGHDPRRGLTVMHGGANTSGRRQDTWEWNGINWTQRAIAAPSAREGHSLAFDAARGELVAFGGEEPPVFFSDTWTYASANDAEYVPFGSGCAGAGGAPVLGADGWSAPFVGSSFTARASNLPSPFVALMFTGFSRTNWGGTPLPFDLGAIGMPGCPLLVSPDVPFPFTASPPGSATWTLPIPNAPQLVGLEFFNQAVVFDPSANTLGLTITNGAAGRIGSR